MNRTDPAPILGTTEVAHTSRQVLRPSGTGRQYVLSMTAEDRAAERGANRQVLVAALAGRPARHERECLAVFAKDGFQLLVDLAESVVVTVFPQGAVIAAIKRRDSGVWAHREGRRTRNTRYAQRRKRRR